MKRHHVSGLLVTGLAAAVTLASGCQSGWNYPVATRVGTSARVFAARVSDLASNRGRLLPFSISGTRRFQSPFVDADRLDPLRRTNDELASLLGTDNELVQALANRDNFQPLPFAVAPQPVKPDQAPDVVEDSRPLQPAEPTSEQVTEKVAEEKPTEATELPSAENFLAEDSTEEAATEASDAELEATDDSAPDVPQPISDEERLREERIQQLLDLLAKAEAVANQNIPELPKAPIIERPLEPVLEKVEPLVIPPPPQAPKEIVLKATATMPYQSVRSERVELLNVQQMAPTIPARPGIPAVVVNPPGPTVNASGWANSDWSKELLPDFSALGASAPEQVEFAPLPPSSEVLNESPTVESQPVRGGGASRGKITPELDSNPATAARPIQKNQERR